jgi:hypothetical protein
LPDREIEFRLALYSPEFALGGGDMALEQQLGMTMMLIVLNISQEMIGESSFQQFPYEVVNREFGADFGVTGLVEGRSDFSKGLALCVGRRLYSGRPGYGDKIRALQRSGCTLRWSHGRRRCHIRCLLLLLVR